MPPGADPFLVGERLEGRYRIGRRIGEGGYAVVHEALAPDGRFVAVKALVKNAEDIDPVAVARFRREMKMAAELRHPNIVEVLDWGQSGDGILYLVMERLEGHTLLDVMYQERFPEASVRHVLKGVLSALDFAHRRGFVHRDVKPSNVFLCPAKAQRGGGEGGSRVGGRGAGDGSGEGPGQIPWTVPKTPSGRGTAGIYGVSLPSEVDAALPHDMDPGHVSGGVGDSGETAQPNPRDTVSDLGPLFLPEGDSGPGPGSGPALAPGPSGSSARDTADGVGLLGRNEAFSLAPDERTTVKVLDFGLSKGLWGKRETFNQDLTSAGKMVGTPGYLAPEQLGDVRITTPLMDLYAVGLLGYEMLMAKPAFEGVGVTAMLQQLTNDPKPPSEEVRALAIYPVVEKLMARDPAKRYQSAEAALRDLERKG